MESEISAKTVLEIIYQDEVMVVINKPTGLLVHRSPIAADASEFAIQVLRDQLGQKVYPVHRLDRKTSGLLVFALNEEVNKDLQMAFMNRKIDKKYVALVRGFITEKGTIDYALTNEAGKVQDALTHFKLLQQFEIEIPNGKFTTARFHWWKLNRKQEGCIKFASILHIFFIQLLVIVRTVVTNKINCF